MSGAGGPKLQYAALPYRRGAGGAIEVMLITSRETGRWIIPKGWPVPGLAPAASAAHEAGEEGGLVGRIGAQPVGVYHYGKRLGDGSIVPCKVEVFALEVERQLPEWPEKAQRSTRWLTSEEAATLVQEPELRQLLRDIKALLG
jgi:8-oxo-dGTP pyrophosphatase MutT (NUDIX family)